MNASYNASTQNWGPGGAFEGKGCEFRYPIIFQDEEGNKIKRRHVDHDLSAAMVCGGYYAFGANELDYLERKYYLKI